MAGAAFGRQAIPVEWRSQIQDALFLERLGEHLANIALGEADNIKVRPGISAMRQGLGVSRGVVKSDMPVVHERLGSGMVTEVDIQSLLSQERTVTLVRIHFDMGQSCKFAFRKDAHSKTLFTI